MTFTLRPYQQQAVDSVIDHVRVNTSPCLIDAATGAGKSLIVAEIANRIEKMSGKKVLCLAPDANLTKQNIEKFKAQAGPCSVFSSSLGRSLRHNVIFGTPISVRNKLSRFGKDVALVMIDECHGITPTIKTIIEGIKRHNPNVRVVGLTATPYRLGTGYIFGQFPDGTFVRDDQVKDPFFDKCVYRIHAQELIDAGYLTPPVIGKIGSGQYDTKGLDPKDKKACDIAYHGHGRLTSGIVADIVAQSQGKMGVAIYAATIEHAQEVMASLPPEISGIVTGKETGNNTTLARFARQELKYIVNVQMLTTGWDAPHIDVVAILRKTESVGLLQQIIGRGLRLHDDKETLTVLDYAGNLEHHCPDGNLFDPLISAVPVKDGELPPVNAECGTCGFVNEFAARPNKDELEVDQFGYFVDLLGNQVKAENGLPFPAHFGRRCLSLDISTGHRCEGRWSAKDCYECQEPNDIAARYCHKCRAELVDPNTKLTLEFKALKRDPSRPQCDVVTGWNVIDGVSKAGNEQWRFDITTEYRKLSFWMLKEPKSDGGYRQLEAVKAATNNLTTTPRTVKYVKDGSKFWRCLGWNMKEDVLDGG